MTDLLANFETYKIKVNSAEKTNSTPRNEVEINIFDTPTNNNDNESEEDNTLYRIVEEFPCFPGGKTSMSEYFKNNISYPVYATESKIEGTVVISAVVEKNGSLSNVKVIKGLGMGCDEEAIKAVKNMPKWIPGKNRGKTVRTEQYITVSFRLKEFD